MKKKKEDKTLLAAKIEYEKSRKCEPGVRFVVCETKCLPNFRKKMDLHFFPCVEAGIKEYYRQIDKNRKGR